MDGLMSIPGHKNITNISIVCELLSQIFTLCDELKLAPCPVAKHERVNFCD